MRVREYGCSARGIQCYGYIILYVGCFVYMFVDLVKRAFILVGDIPGYKNDRYY